MADKQPAKANRRVKNPETFRERAVKASQTTDKPKRRSWFGRALKAIFAPIGALFNWLGKFRPFRIIGKILVPPYFRNSWKELKQVTWPSWKQSRQLTFAVIIFAVIFGAIIAVVDYGLDKLFRQILLGN
jgi:preprotein translocase SecE subunit